LSEQFSAFLDEAHRLKPVYQSKLELLVGLETEYITSVDLDELGALLERHGERIEYVVGSVHHVNAIPIDFDRQTYDRAVSSFRHDHALSAFLESYFDAQYTLMRRFHPEVIGHMDLCRLYTPFLRFQEYPLALEKLERNVCFGAEYGALFEVNAAAFRKGWDEAYPGGDVIEV
jgi:histidinol-phosphatase (PHP family)